LIAVVTGGGRGIGRAAAVLLAKRGCDVGNPGEVERAARKVLELGTPQVVLNNAGIVRRARIEDTKDEDWDGVLRANLYGTFFVTRAFLPSMYSRGKGRVVNVGSISSTLGTAGASAYCAAKWGVVGFTKSLAEEMRGSGLQTMCILPGSVDTEMLKGSGFTAQMSPEEVAGTIVYAALDAPDAMNGSAMEVFGP
jgi:3-oxoacyl-[acyl-carrier protein] reductase